MLYLAGIFFCLIFYEPGLYCVLQKKSEPNRIKHVYSHVGQNSFRLVQIISSSLGVCPFHYRSIE